MNHTHSGFTLIELLITIAIVAILSAVGYPMYASYVQRANPGEAFAQLAQMRNQLEQYYQDNRDYGSSASTCGGTVNPIPSSSTPAGTQYFSYSCSWNVGSSDSNNGSNQAYLLKATGLAAKNMSSYEYTLDYLGNKATTAFPDASNLPRPCWLNKVGDC